MNHTGEDDEDVRKTDRIWCTPQPSHGRILHICRRKGHDAADGDEDEAILKKMKGSSRALIPPDSVLEGQWA